MKVRRALHHISEVEAAAAPFLARVTMELAPVGPLDERGLQPWRGVFSERPPIEVALGSGDAIHNLRAALDLMVCDIARQRRGENRALNRRLEFPFARSEQKLRDALKDAKFKQLGPEVRAYLASLRPYKGGNDALYGLHDYDIRDKHRMIIPVFAAALNPVPLELSLPGQRIMPGVPLHRYQRYIMISEDGGVSAPPGKRPIMPFESAGIDLLFPSSSPFPNANVVKSLNNLAKYIAGIVETFARKFGPQTAAASPEL